MSKNVVIGMMQYLYDLHHNRAPNFIFKRFICISKTPYLDALYKFETY